MTRAWCSAVPGGVRLAVQVTPNARKSVVVEALDDALKLKLQAQPIEGKANEELINFLARTLGLPRSAITITHGLTSRRKLVQIAGPGLHVDAVCVRLLAPP